MKMKKLSVLLLSTVIVLGGLSGCRSAEPEASAEENTGSGDAGEEVTLRILATGTDYPDVIDEAVKERYPNITLEWETISWNDLQGKMQQYMQSGVPDIVIGKSQDANNYGNYNVWEDLTEKPYIKAVNEQAIPGVSMNGRVLGMSYTALYGGVFYNKQIFEEQGLEIPENWAEFEMVTEKLKAAGITPFATHYMENILYTTAIVTGLDLIDSSDTWGEEFREGTKNAKDAEYAGGYEKVKFMMDNSWEDTYSVDQTTCDARFVKGEAAMQMDGSWCINNYLMLDENFAFGMFPMPNEKGDARLIFEPDITFFKSADTDHPDIVDDIFTLLTEPQVAGAVCDSVSEGSLIEGARVTFNNPSQPDIDKYTEEGRILDQNIITNQLPASGFWDECSSDLSEWLHGNMTLEEALDAANNRRDVCGFKTLE